MNRRSQLRRRTALARGESRLARRPACRGCTSTLKPMSDQRRAQLPTRAEVRERVKARDGGCVAVALVPEVKCWGILEVDEVKNRAAGGDWLDEDQCQTLCSAHHRWKTEHKDEATARGLAKRSWQ